MEKKDFLKLIANAQEYSSEQDKWSDLGISIFESPLSEIGWDFFNIAIKMSFTEYGEDLINKWLFEKPLRVFNKNKEELPSETIEDLWESVKNHRKMDREELLCDYFPEYFKAKELLNQFSDYELELLVDNLPDSVDDIGESIICELQWAIATDLLGPFIEEWDDFLYNYEESIMDYLVEQPYMSYNEDTKAYEINKNVIHDCCKELTDDTEYKVLDVVDFDMIIDNLNDNYPVKFCKA